MSHLRLIPDAELPRVVDDDGTERDATRQELLDHGLQRVATHPNGPGIYSVACTAPCPGHPGTDLASGFLQERHDRLPEELQHQVLRARVFRSTDASDLRKRLEADLGTTIAPREPRLGRRPDRDHRKQDPVLDECRRLAADEQEPVERLEVAMGDVEDSDVVEDDSIFPMRWAGEVSTR